ncbi:MAG: hypothetical protein AB1758_01290 [Candidatus Eremiobacterota bacterium]
MSRGLTLAEVLVGAGLSLVLLGVVVGLFLGAGNLWLHSSCRSELQQTAALALDRMVSDLRGSAAEGVSWDADSRLSVRPVLDVDAEGRLTWDEQVTLYYVSHGSLWSRREGLGLAAGPRVPAQELAALCADGSSANAMARDLQSFRVRGTPSLVRLELILARRLPSGEVVRFQLDRSVLIRTP